MLKIDRLRLSLPAGFEARAGRIGRMVAERLADVPPQSGVALERLVPPPVEVTCVLSDREVAERVAAAVHGQLGRVVAGDRLGEGATLRSPGRSPGQGGASGRR